MIKKSDSSALQIVARSEMAAADWNDVVEGSPDGWVFSLFGWQDLILAADKWGLEEFSFGLRENGKLIAEIPLQSNRHNRKISSSGWGGSGPVLHGSLVGKSRFRVMRAALDHRVALGRQCGASHFDFSVSPVTRSSITSAWGVNPFVSFGFEGSVNPLSSNRSGAIRRGPMGRIVCGCAAPGAHRSGKWLYGGACKLGAES